MADRSQYLGEMIQDKDSKKSENVIKALLQMNKIDIQGLREGILRKLIEVHGTVFPLLCLEQISSSVTNRLCEI